jgi:hypothetical protein
MYDVAIENSLFVKASRAGYGHGAYPNAIACDSTNGAVALVGFQEGVHRYLILWSEAPPDNVYPVMSAAKAQMEDQTRFFNAPQGGVRMDMDFRIGTYGLYAPARNCFTREFWADFDHWPIIPDTLSLIPGLADGHYHPGLRTASQQLPVTDEMRDIMMLLHFAAH